MKYIAIIAVIAILVGGYLYTRSDSAKDSTGALQSSSAPLSQADLTPAQSYRNDTYSFSFKYPKNFAVRKIAGEGSDTILVEDEADTRQAFQIVIQPMDEDIAQLDEARIRKDLPDLMINEPSEVLIGAGGKGLAFLSDNESFGGASREIWFVYKRNFYQISSYKANDPLIQAVLGTWMFE
jgi:hypothetical protein